jgi:PERQ amino acid-rich with GYF domain-containing protein
MNGTLTFRRTSTTPSSQAFNQPNMSEPAGSSDDPAVLAAMPVGSTVVENAMPQRYSREDMLSIFNNMQQDPRAQQQQPDVSALFVSGWNPGHVNGVSSRSGWGKSGDSHVLPQEPDMCWDAPGSTKAMGFQDITPEEKEVGLTILPSLRD